ncbi:MAG: ISL3 family transposase [Cyanobacteria bacterium J06639_18]
MELLSHLLPDTTNLQLHSYQFDETQASIILIVASTPHVVSCPVCNCLTHKIHSHYERKLTDLPWGSYKIILQLRVRKFFCINQACLRRIFTERLSKVTVPWGRRTQRLTSRLTCVALELGGAAGERLSKDLGIKVSRNTLLGLIRKLPLPSFPNLRTLGVDDFAFRKGRHYGTILVDLDQSLPVGLLGDRESGTLAQWLNQYPGIQVLSRDRSKVYKNGMKIGAPQAIQVADRFHLLKNLTEVLEKFFRGYGKELKAVEATYRFQLVNDSSGAQEVVPVSPPRSTAQVQKQTEERRKKRLATYNKVWELHKQGWSTSTIAHQVGMSSRTVQRYLRMTNFPEHQSRSDRGRSLLNPYKQYIVQRWNSGQYEAKALFEEIQQQGYGGSYMTVTRYIRQLCQAQGWELRRRPKSLFVNQTGVNKLPPVADPQQPPLTARRAAWLVVQPLEKRDSKSEQLIDQLIAQHPDLSIAIDWAQDFTQIVRQHQPEKFDIWLKQALHSNLIPLKNFAQSLNEDYQAVKAGVTLPTSNGPVEGHINRLKMLKRQMYGRAGIDLLERRFLLAS